ncbi:hypothetical protein SODALDRAFT_94949 [Sodiomyces alkalinus F11]|uniref:Uncharacterized protein n=1 Tax=Sodiomyces alkalinus (strain CBS 110278 / VKM F-3762 / F11) TaxID=1314773 RepID=A0A3N2Q0Y3_SODAK|nr:hypothetical protein SODALDRAFT_94949 [Sodiomyces alkalinus F11]ROT40366.1 hypothetical protein SODALDRAFT_94949 [Sodiomyces alkalinus F11]
MAAPFTDDEKRFILCEMIKQSKLDVDVLVNLVKSRNIEPDWWFSMHLPHGRTINQCLEAASDMLETTMERPSLKRKSLGDLHDEHATKRSTVTELLSQPSPSTPSVAASHPGTLTPVSAPARADCFFQQSVPNTRHVNIRPRPPVTGTPVPSAPPPLPPGPIQPAPTGRRRGRPPRADKTRQLRPLLPQNLAPLAPRIDSQPAAGTRLLPPGSSPDTGAGPHTTAEETHQTSESARTPGQQSVGALKAAKKRGRPPLADKTRTASLFLRRLATLSILC